MKAEIYAAAGVPEYWVVGLADGQDEVHTEPAGGAYARVALARRGDRIRPTALPGVEIPTDEIFR